jgi:hypothetical protein
MATAAKIIRSEGQSLKRPVESAGLSEFFSAGF